LNPARKETAMNINDEEAYDHKMEEIIVSLEVFILDVLGTAVKRLLDNNAAFLQNVPSQNRDDDF
jgi:hypothetical protein